MTGVTVFDQEASSPADFAEYQREKYALIQVANFLKKGGYEVKLSVQPLDLVAADLSRIGTTPPDIDIALAQADYDYGYRIYYDTPGAIDLVAVNGTEVLLAEGKGAGKGTVQGTAPHGERVWDLVAATVGRLVLEARPDRNEMYAVVLPDAPEFVKVLATIHEDNPVLARMPLRAYLVTARGEVRCVDLPMTPTSIRAREPGR